MTKEDTLHELAFLGREIRNGFGVFVSSRVENGPSPFDGRMLAYIVDHPGVSSSDICAAFRLTKSTVSESLSNLASFGMVCLERSKGDARQKKIVATEKGIAHKAQIDEAIRLYDQAIMKGIGDEEIQTINKIVEKIHKNMKEVANDE